MGIEMRGAVAGLLLIASVAKGEEDRVASARAEFETLKTLVVSALGAPFESPVSFEIVPRGRHERTRVKNLEVDHETRARLEARRRLFEKLRMVPNHFVRGLRGTPAAWYDLDSRTVFVEEAAIEPPARAWLHMSLLHELAHAHRSMSGLYPQVAGLVFGVDRDRELAAHCIQEGDAELLSKLLRLARSVENPRRKPAGWLRRHEEVGGAISAAMSTTWLYPEGSSVAAPYFEGFSLALVVFRKRGLPGLREALAEPPRSTEQVLHPEKYISEQPDEPTLFVEPDIPDPVAPGWSRIDRGTLGEYDLQCLFRGRLGAQRARRVASGWDGSFYHLHAPPETGACLLTMITTWDSDDDAAEFALAWCDWAGRRDGGPFRVETAPTVAGGKRSLTTADGQVIVVRRGLDVIVLDGLRGVERGPILRAYWDAARVKPDGGRRR